MEPLFCFRFISFVSWRRSADFGFDAAGILGTASCHVLTLTRFRGVGQLIEAGAATSREIVAQSRERGAQK